MAPASFRVVAPLHLAQASILSELVMAKESNDQENEGPGGKRLLPLGIAIALGLLVGGGAGAFVAGPLLAARSEAPAPKAAEREAPAEEDHGEEAESESSGAEEGGDHEGEAGGQALYVMDNLVLNPARSGGTRFLMVTIAFSLQNEALSEEMKARDAEVRDAVLGVLGAKSVIELSDVAARDSLKVELKSNVSDLFHKGAVRQIYFPQFVIQ